MAKDSMIFDLKHYQPLNKSQDKLNQNLDLLVNASVKAMNQATIRSLFTYISLYEYSDGTSMDIDDNKMIISFNLPNKNLPVAMHLVEDYFVRSSKLMVKESTSMPLDN